MLIAILPTKYPFFRGYKLTEQLCNSAKKSMRNRNLVREKNLSEEKILSGSSWLDFAILHGEQAPTLEQIRSTEYHGARGNLHFGPYRLCNQDAPFKRDRLHNLENLLECTIKFSKSMAKNKIKKLRYILQSGQDDVEKFLQRLAYQQQHLPEVADWDNFQANLWHADATPYVDAIELMDFYNEESVKIWQKLTRQ